MEVVSTKAAPAPIAPYSQAIKAGGFLFISGSAGTDPNTGAIVEGGLAAQTEQTLRNLSATVTAAGSTLEKVVKVTVYLKNIEDYEEMNRIYQRWWLKHFPARTTVGVAALPRPEILIEIDAIAML
ncbi:Rid family detoxifying hydrolase [bacterium]|nr:Rid family detoxifying hydrolase [bacterium]